MRRTAAVQNLEYKRYRSLEKSKKYSENPEEKTTQKYEAQPENMKTYANLLQKRVKSLSRARPTHAAVRQQSRMGEG